MDGGQLNYASIFFMWLAMTGVMMAPVVFPWLQALRRISAETSERASLGPFIAGYAAAWAAFSGVAAAAQLSLLSLDIPVPFRLDAPVLSAAALFLAGGFQFTKLKEACLSHCRSPAGYLLTHWRDGAAGRARMGFGHGLYCVGCCWALMALALVVGMIDLVWMGVLVAVMVAETVLPSGPRIAKSAGIGLVVVGAVLFILAG